MSEELKCCPSVICGSGDVTISTFARRLWIVECNECHARTRPHGIKEEAITDWNTRPTEASCTEKPDVSKGEERDIICPKCKTHKMERIGSNSRFYHYLCSDENCTYYVDVNKETGKVFHPYGINPAEGSDREEMSRGDDETEFCIETKPVLHKVGTIWGCVGCLTRKTIKKSEIVSQTIDDSDCIHDALPYMNKLPVTPFKVGLVPKHIDPKEHPLTPDMVGRVVLVDECNVMALMYIYFDGKQGRRFNYSYASDGVNLGGTLDKSNIKYYYFIR